MSDVELKSVAVIVPAVKLPELSRATIADAVFADVAVVALLGNPVQFVNVPDAGVPRTGVVKVGDVKVLLVKVSVLLAVATVTPSIVTVPAEPLAIVVSVALPSSIDPTPKLVEVDDVNPLIGNPVQFVNVPDAGVPNTGVVKVGEVSVLLVKVSVLLAVATVTPSIVTTPAEPLAIVVSVACPNSIVVDVITPVTFRLLNVEVPDVLIPVDTVTVAEPAAKEADTPAPTKLIVPAVPTAVPSSLITIPLPDT